jgi:hypothetical protein
MNYGEIDITKRYKDEHALLQLKDGHYWIAAFTLYHGLTTKVFAIDNYGDVYITTIASYGTLTLLNAPLFSKCKLPNKLIDIIKILDNVAINNESDVMKYTITIMLAFSKSAQDDMDAMKKNGYNVHNDLTIMKHGMKLLEDNCKREMNEVVNSMQQKVGAIQKNITHHVNTITAEYNDYKKIMNDTVSILENHSQIIKLLQTHNKNVHEQFNAVIATTVELNKKYNYIMNTIIIAIIIYILVR